MRRESGEKGMRDRQMGDWGRHRRFKKSKYKALDQGMGRK
jgi:hypothetical protein